MADEIKKSAWYSIKEAAEYLEIGEPTLYRWMRDRKITFRKVGDSTRFLQEDLDAVVEVFHSERDAEQVKQVCPVCHGTELLPAVCVPPDCCISSSKRVSSGLSPTTVSKARA